MTRKEQIEARKLELRSEIENAETEEQVEKLEQEVEALTEEEGQIEEQEKNQVIAEELEEQKSFAKEIKMEERKMENLEVRNTKQYVDAYAEYIKTGKDAECRALLTENVEGEVAVPDFVYDVVKTAWDKSEIMSLVKKISVKGNLKVNFERSATPAEIHTEGDTTPVQEEELHLGIITLTPVSIKKWISLSDEVYDMRGEAFVRYIYEELTDKIVKKTAETLITKIKELPAEATKESVSAEKVASAPALDTVFKGIAALSDAATNPVVVMNKRTYANFKSIQLQSSYAVDIFDGLKVVFDNNLPAYDAASTDEVYAIVGDFEEGALANFVNGESVEIKFDDKTLMTTDMIRILGRQYVGIEAVADKAFALITKPEEA